MRKRRIPEWLEGALIALASVILIAAMCWVIWFLYELVWTIKCAFGV